MDAAPDIPVFKMMLEGIGFTISAATSISNQEGINQSIVIEALSNDGQGMGQAEHLIDVVRKPIEGQDGHVINARAQELFNLAVYYVWIFNKTSRELSLEAMTTAGLRALQHQRVLEKSSLEVDMGGIPKYNGHEISKMFEEIREYLTRLRGFTKIQLLYIIRKIHIPPLSSNDDETNYMDNYAEMIAHVPILERGAIAAADEVCLALQNTNGPWNSNAIIDQRVGYVVMQNIFGTHHLWKFTAGQRRSKLGSVVYWICYNKLLGQSMVDNMA